MPIMRSSLCRWWGWLCWWRPPCLLRVVLVNLASSNDAAIRGVLWRSRGAWVVLRSASMLQVSGVPIPLDGDVIVHRDNIAFIQVLP